MGQLEARKTKVTIEEMAVAFHVAYAQYFNSRPHDEAIKILLSHWALETGWGKSMWCYNVGNCKSREDDGYDYCFFPCNEILKTSQAQRMQKESAKAEITRNRSDGTSIIWFYPDHPYSRFRAFETLNEGVFDHLKLIVKRFDKAWPFIYRGDPLGYSKALKEQRYYTADESSYTRTLVKVFHMFDDIKFPQEDYLSTSDKAGIMASVSASLRGMTEEHLKDVRQLIDED